MDGPVELEMCGNCKKEIPHNNYVMHTAHCARKIRLCQLCKEPVPKNDFEAHKKRCFGKNKSSPEPSFSSSSRNKFESSYQKSLLKKSEKQESYMYNHRNSFGEAPSALKQEPATKPEARPHNGISFTSNASKLYAPKSGMLPCKYCDLELPKLELEDHENYCGARTDRCNDCGELVMFKYKKIHEDTNHGFLKLSDEPGPKPSWDSATERQNTGRGSSSAEEGAARRPPPLRPFTYETTRSIYENYTPPVYDDPLNSNEKKESYKDISRRLDCKTEYIRNLLHDSASITVPIRHTGTVPRNHYNHNKGPAPQPPRRRNPPTELVIPCEFCDTPIPHEDLIQHETGCRPDLARRRRSVSPDDYFVAPEPSSPEVELPCEFCSDMIPASQLLGHQSTCI